MRASNLTFYTNLLDRDLLLFRLGAPRPSLGAVSRAILRLNWTKFNVLEITASGVQSIHAIQTFEAAEQSRRLPASTKRQPGLSEPASKERVQGQKLLAANSVLLLPDCPPRSQSRV